MEEVVESVMSGTSAQGYFLEHFQKFLSLQEEFEINTLLKKYLLSLQEEYKQIEEAEESLCQGNEKEELLRYKSWVHFCLKEIKNLEKSAVPGHDPHLSLHPRSANAKMNTNTNTTRVCSFQRSSLNENEIKDSVEPRDNRYLCITDGFVIHCLDLKQSSSSGIQSFPKISTLTLLEKGLPVSMGLFKLGPNAYLISGQKFPGFKNQPNLKFPDWLYKKYGFKGSSKKTYHLSLVDGDLCLYECDSVPLLKKPKVWPIVERIGDQIHVIESIPPGFYSPYTVPTHEVLNLNDDLRDWTKLSPMSYPGVFIDNYLALGDVIFATTRGLSSVFVFDSKTSKWESRDCSECPTIHVTNTSGFRNGICAGEILEDLKDPLYVVFGIGNVPTRQDEDDDDDDVSYDDDDDYKDAMDIVAVAYLVTATGQVLCVQEVPGFFEGLEMPSYMLQATLFHVNENERTMCAVVLAKDLRMDEGTRQDFLYVCTFTLEAAAFKPNVVEAPHIERRGFVNVVFKERHIYRAGAELRAKGNRNTCPPRLSACFL